MKKLITGYILFFVSFVALSAQDQSSLDRCMSLAGTNAKYLKDFRIQLRDGKQGAEMRFTSAISLSKGVIYRFTLCNEGNSKGKLIMNLKNSSDKVVISSWDEKTGSMKVNLDFKCKKSGLYKICCDFNNGQAGSGIAVVSVLQ